MTHNNPRPHPARIDDATAHAMRRAVAALAVANAHLRRTGPAAAAEQWSDVLQLAQYARGAALFAAGRLYA